ncbi:MAG: hypothetical protein OXJ62_05065 [Spirochaetaceae bacterium]|nr:hypothetical protein [Spirochaetaceae bacterium]
MNYQVSVPVHAIEMVLLPILYRCLQPHAQVATEATSELKDLLHIRITKRSQAALAERHDTTIGSISDEAQHYFSQRNLQIRTYQNTGVPSQCSLQFIVDVRRMGKRGADLVLNSLALAV